jgi:hypothetical protein
MKKSASSTVFTRCVSVTSRATPRAPALACAVALGGALLVAPSARAQEGESANAHQKLHDGITDVSPQYAAFEIRIGGYSPKVDQNTSEPVYTDFFGDKQRFIFGIEADWQAWRAPYIGTLGIGFGWGYTQMSASNKVPPADPPVEDVVQASTLNIMPLYAVGVLRVDTFARNYRVPIVPYAKLGLAYALWWVNDGLGTATSDNGTKGRDVSVGTQAAIGGMFLLDILEPSAARAADSDGGLNNSYIFFEWAMSNYGGDQMNVGSNSWVTGLAFEM